MSEPRINLWRPGVSEVLSIPFTPLFGCWIQAKNWDAIGLPARARRSRLWMIPTIVVFGLAIAAFLADAGSPAAEITSFLDLTLLGTWWALEGRNQRIYVADVLEGQYGKRSWVEPLALAFTAVFTLGFAYQMLHPEPGTIAATASELPARVWRTLGSGAAFFGSFVTATALVVALVASRRARARIFWRHGTAPALRTLGCLALAGFGVAAMSMSSAPLEEIDPQAAERLVQAPPAEVSETVD